jgi:serine/threonine protein phosphatase PrpC
MALFESVQRSNLKFQLGCETDIGGGRENQDDSFIWIKREFNLIVLCVLDGHGREVGKIAAVAAKDCLIKYLDSEFVDLLHHPVECLVKAHQLAHHHIRETFRSELEKQGYQVKQSDDGYLMKRKSGLEYCRCNMSSDTSFNLF